MSPLHLVVFVVSAAIGGITTGALLSGRYKKHTRALATSGWVAMAALYIVIFKNFPR